MTQSAMRKVGFVVAATDHGSLIVDRFDRHVLSPCRATGVKSLPTATPFGSLLAAALSAAADLYLFTSSDDEALARRLGAGDKDQPFLNGKAISRRRYRPLRVPAS